MRLTSIPSSCRSWNYGPWTAGRGQGRGFSGPVRRAIPSCSSAGPLGESGPCALTGMSVRMGIVWIWWRVYRCASVRRSLILSHLSSWILDSASTADKELVISETKSVRKSRKKSTNRRVKANFLLKYSELCSLDPPRVARLSVDDERFHVMDLGFYLIARCNVMQSVFPFESSARTNTTGHLVIGAGLRTRGRT